MSSAFFLVSVCQLPFAIAWCLLAPPLLSAWGSSCCGSYLGIFRLMGKDLPEPSGTESIIPSTAGGIKL